MGSTRLPGKSMMDLCGHPVLWHVIERVRAVPEIRCVVVATSREPQDAIIYQKARQWGAMVYRGDEADVLDRFYQAAAHHGMSAAVRITADCPLIDPAVISRVIQRFQDTGCDYCSNVFDPQGGENRTFPDGLDCEIVRMTALDKAWDVAGSKFDREHVTPFIWSQPGLFHVELVKAPKDYSALRWTLDTAEDLEHIRVLMSHVPPGMFDYRRLLPKG